LHKHLPKGVSVLDCCAGTGAYAFALAKAGYKVTAGDLTQRHIDEIIAKNTDGLLDYVYQGSAMEMSQFADESFDVVLCFGALYHLFEKEDREAVITECIRVLKKGGIFAFSYVNRHGIFITRIHGGDDVANALEMTKTGRHDVFYCMNFDEADEIMTAFPITKITNAGVNGVLYPLMEQLNAMKPEDFALYMDYHLITCEQPSVLANSVHGLWIGRKNT